MATKEKKGPGRARKEGKGRVTPKAGGVGRYTDPQMSGRYTAPTPRTVRRSPRWYGPVLIAAFILGMLTILLNYLTVLPGSVSTWYLIGGLVVIFGGFVMATRYR